MFFRKSVLLLISLLIVSLGLPAGSEAAAGGIRAVSVSGGSAHGVAAWSDGTVTGWGDNKYGQVGDGTSINQYIPRQVAGLRGIVQVAAARSVSFALSKDGEVWGWGRDYSSYIQNDPQLRDQKRGGPVKLEGLQEVSSITTNGNLGIAVKKDGTVTLWYPSYDQPGVLPVQIRYLALKGVTEVKSALINGNDALFLSKEGSVKQLSIVNTVYNRIRLESDPVSVATIASSSINGMAATQGELFLLRSDGQVLRWNKGLKALSAVAGLNNVYKLDTGFYRLFALKGNGTLWQWNYNSGALAKPYQIKKGNQISNIWGSSGTFGFAQHKDGTLLGWGDGFDTGLATGRGTVTKDQAGFILTPVQPPLMFFVNDELFSFYGSSSIKDGKLYVPPNSVFKALGVKVSNGTFKPDPKYGNAQFTSWSFAYGNNIVQVKVSDPPELYINGKKSDREFTMNRLPDSAQVPLETICDLLGIGLQWNKSTGEVRLEN